MRLRLRNRPAFTVTEILGVIILVGAFLVIAGQLLHTSTVLSHQSGQAMSRAAQQQTLLDALRSDVWTAKEINVKPDHLAITDPNDLTVSWEISADGKMSRYVGKGESRQHLESATGWSFSDDGPALIVHAGREGDIVMVSEIKLMRPR